MSGHPDCKLCQGFGYTGIGVTHECDCIRDRVYKRGLWEKAPSSPAPVATPPLALGSAAWLRAQANEKEEMMEAMPSATEEFRNEDKREILGLRDAAARMDLLDATLTACHAAMLGKVNPKSPAWGMLFAAQDSNWRNTRKGQI